MSDWCFWLTWSSIAIILLYVHFECHYFLRMCICVLLARFIKTKRHILDTTTVYGICLTNDIDTLLCHMNNARYLRELDFARADFYERTKLYSTILNKGGSVYQGAATIRYRKLIKPLRIFRITSKVSKNQIWIVYWDDQSIYMEHRFIRPSDQFVHCIAICRQRILNCSVLEIINELLKMTITHQQLRQHEQYQQNQQHEENSVVEHHNNLDQILTENGQTVNNIKWRPQLPPDIRKWIEYNDLSSKTLRQSS